MLSRGTSGPALPAALRADSAAKALDDSGTDTDDDGNLIAQARIARDAMIQQKAAPKRRAPSGAHLSGMQVQCARDRQGRQIHLHIMFASHSRGCSVLMALLRLAWLAFADLPVHLGAPLHFTAWEHLLLLRTVAT